MAPEDQAPRTQHLAGLIPHPGQGWASRTWEPRAHTVRPGVGVREARTEPHTEDRPGSPPAMLTHTRSLSAQRLDVERAAESPCLSPSSLEMWTKGRISVKDRPEPEPQRAQRKPGRLTAPWGHSHCPPAPICAPTPARSRQCAPPRRGLVTGHRGYRLVCCVTFFSVGGRGGLCACCVCLAV